MTAIRERLAGTAGNNPQTRIVCDGGDYARGGSPCRSLPVTDYDAREARKRARAHGWTRANGKDYCPDHRPGGPLGTDDIDAMLSVAAPEIVDSLLDIRNGERG